MNNRLVNLLASAGVALAVSVSVGGASPTPTKAPPTHGISTAVLWQASGPSAADVNKAQSRQIAELKNAVAQLKRTINDVALQAQDSADVTNCINGALFVTLDDEGNVVSASTDDPDGSAIATLDPECVSTEDAS